MPYPWEVEETLEILIWTQCVCTLTTFRLLARGRAILTTAWDNIDKALRVRDVVEARQSSAN